MKLAKFISAGVIVFLTACSSPVVNNSAGESSDYQNPNKASDMGGVGIESNDIVAMTDKMLRSMLANSTLSSKTKAPRVIVDAEYISNESTSRVNKNLLGDRLRIQLNRAASGRMVFVARHLSNMVEKERELKREGVVDAGTIRTTQAQAGADYRLGGRIMSQDALQTDSQQVSRYHLVTFEMVDLELGTVVWSDMYEFKKQAQDNVMYR